MFQAVFMGPLNNPENEKLRDINKGELAIMLSFILFIVWIGLAPSGFFRLMDTTVATLVNDIQSTVVAFLP
jgi:NADH:ubiquinone oxidoreductase subunit 4 (subunit M)